MGPPDEGSSVEQRALQHNQAGLLTFSDDGIVRYANDRLHDWLGLEPASLPGQHVDRLLTPASRIFHTTHFFPLLKLHGHAREVHMLLRDAAGADLPVLVSAVREMAATPLNHCSMMPMRRRTEFEAALVDARKAAEAATVAKDQFLAMVSHELRAPLSAITGWVGLARSGKLDALQQQRALETIERNAQAQAQLIEDLLDVSRIVSGQMRMTLQPIELAAVVESACETVRPAAGVKQIDLICSLDRNAGLVHADPARVHQIVWNLLANAVKFTPVGGRVEVRLLRIGLNVRVRVADTGPGIDPAQLPHLFDRFWQADQSGRTEGSGIGLGLSICKHLVELHGGTISVESAGIGKGTAFTIELPVIENSLEGRGDAGVSPEWLPKDG